MGLSATARAEWKSGITEKSGSKYLIGYKQLKFDKFPDF